jgi:hypothetical protein
VTKNKHEVFDDSIILIRIKNHLIDNVCVRREIILEIIPNSEGFEALDFI